ncbi:zinc dependent phospholipase C family protein [Paenibacillus urinalis]|uniref:zinc dependent phospholipase C family protein n=1 Tax=Paenibacillus urinalis TaxID=521520 RepID=UPI002368E90F|nr:zinc dependent phospholipase C family protein [Paenibacillus urinalis]WDH95427.1 zinc dependent phospholipase C family protein [Paenibacillus urinalis]
MGSRIMHLIIANRIAESLSMEDRTLFLLGSLAPDAVSPKESSHFFKGEVQNYTRFIDYKGFLHKYSSQAEQQYILGYFTHLIADDIWLRGFNLSWLENRMEADPDLYPIYHKDFQTLNGKLLEHYGFTNILKEMLSDVPAVMDLEEVKSKDVEHFLPYVLGDMEYDKDEVNKQQLQVFTFVQILGYIETSVDMGLLHLKPMLDVV